MENYFVLFEAYLLSELKTNCRIYANLTDDERCRGMDSFYHGVINTLEEAIEKLYKLQGKEN